MNKNFIRIAFGTLFGIILLTVAMLLLKNPASLLWAGYAWSVFALLIFGISLGYWAKGSKIKYFLFAAYPLLIKSYLAATVFFALLFSAISYAGFWTMPVGWFCLLEAAILALTAWKVLAMNAARDAVLAVEDEVKAATISWKMLVIDMAAIAERGAAADKKELDRVAAAIRYADPVEHKAVESLVIRINDQIVALGTAVDAGNSEKIAEIGIVIERLVKERANKLLALK